MELAQGILPTQNVALLMELIEGVRGRAEGLPGMGCFYGGYGVGKSRAVAANAVACNAYYVQVQYLWTRNYLLEMILRQMNAPKIEKTAPRMLTQIGQQLAKSGRPLIIDDAHVALERNMGGVLYSLYEASQGSVILVGEENLPWLLEQIGRLHSRMLNWVEAQPTGLDDARQFAGKYCAGIRVAEALLERIIEETRGVARYICTNLAQVKEYCNQQDLDSIGAEYPKPLFTGKTPERRKK